MTIPKLKLFIWAGLLLLVVLPLMVSALDSSYIFKQNEVTNFSMPCYNNANAVCGADVKCYLTVHDAGIDYQNMTYNTGGQYNYSFSLSQLKVYDARVDCCQDADCGFATFGIEVTYTGDAITQQQTYFYIIGLIFLILLIFGIVFIINKLPNKDAIDEDGAILHVSQLKHLRSVLWVVVWGLGLAIMFILSNVTLAFLNNELLGKLFFVLFQIMMWVTIIGVPIYFIWIFYKMWKDKEMQRMIYRGVEMRGTP